MSDPGSSVGAASERAGAPSPGAPGTETSLTELPKESWKYVLRTTVREFTRDQCFDEAAALTYYAILAAAPALLAVVSLLGLFGNAESMVNDVVKSLGDVLPQETTQMISTLTKNAAGAGGRAGVALVIGVVLAVWSASGYVGAFGRTMNRIYGIDEGRPIWKLRPILLLVTLLVLLVAVAMIVALVMSGSLARAVGDVIGLGDVALTVWGIVKWPVVLLLVIVLVAVLFHATPNVQHSRFRWISVGSVVAIVVWGLASLGFGFYVQRFASYNATYGSLAGIIVFLLWVWITNLALLFGAELDAELERVRELHGGIAAEEELQLSPRDTRASDKRAAKLQADVERGRELREAAGRRGADE
ncbi:YihY/virulence factor BrkB family protein [Xylanimonas sp. McL0601]|uniref:YihY/virulence factor BrkB family protein n=1 Tax=Xylanimonas sp. McL0601 TaxID=3414739 RepID=UPI003CF0A614